ncbi:abortive infection system antitoxin AbiGi family protein [Shumkonia mesophila]|uniref:abortive infection system antitoxin AbiGi family protein n=1 Tax=Shumkonia mesophila TaxID=2838854 RepID=UPI002934F6FD|nr:abortive infection system antitoxin AbiGi family protein [Shumkonia mesophila]
MDVELSYDRAVHSDFLIHWTGKDIDQAHDPKWYDGDHRSKPDPIVEDLYAQRLQSILTYGLWMTEESEREVSVGGSKITIPPTPQCCFTELKLSDSRRHARRYGRLGIGVKRPFLFQRHGRPLAYYGFADTKADDMFLMACWQDLRDRRLLNFFKPMNSDQTELTYELYAESEWRILLFDEHLKDRKIVDPRDSANVEENKYFNGLPPEQQERLKYLIPLDGWFAMIIYPSLGVKNKARWEDSYGVHREIERIKTTPDHGNQVEGLRSPVRGNWPIEVTVDACRNF